MSEKYGCKIYLKREDLNHTGAHKINNTIGPIHANLSVKHRAQILAVDDDEALEAAFELTRLEGIIPALESAHALGALAKVNFKPEEVVVLTVSGRGDKDMDTYINYKLS